MKNIHQHDKMRYLSSVEHQMVKYQTLYVQYHFNHMNLDIYASCTDECRYHLQQGVDGLTDQDKRQLLAVVHDIKVVYIFLWLITVLKLV